MQRRNGRRGAVFPIRLTDEDKLALQRLQQQLGGPEPLGPWLIWNALYRGNTRAGDAGITCSSAKARRLVIPACAVLPVQARTGITRAPRRQRIILDLCGGSGAWSAPYRAAGFRVVNVTLPKHDVRTYVPPESVYGVLAAPPCTEFSLAKNGQSRDYLSGLETVAACMRIIMRCQPLWWALENPVGMLQKWLGTPQLVFEPYHFGDPWKKRTAIWGTFTMPVPGPYVKPLGSGPFCRVCDPSGKRTSFCRSAAHRAVTPPGFARAFFEANP